MEWMKQVLDNGRKLEMKKDKRIKAKLDSIDMKLKKNVQENIEKNKGDAQGTFFHYSISGYADECILRDRRLSISGCFPEFGGVKYGLRAIVEWFVEQGAEDGGQTTDDGSQMTAEGRQWAEDKAIRRL